MLTVLGKVYSDASFLSSTSLSAFADQLAADEHGVGVLAVEFVQKLHVGKITGRDRAEVAEAVFACGIVGGKADGVDGIEPERQRVLDDAVDMAGLQNVARVDVVGADGDVVRPAHPLKSLQKLGQKADGKGAGLKIDVRCPCRALSDLFRRAGFVRS